MVLRKRSLNVSELTLRLNHDTEDFRVMLDGRTIGRYESVETVTGQNGRWWIFTGRRVTYVLRRESRS